MSELIVPDTIYTVRFEEGENMELHASLSRLDYYPWLGQFSLKTLDYNNGKQEPVEAFIGKKLGEQLLDKTNIVAVVRVNMFQSEYDNYVTDQANNLERWKI